jgi:hypothetical protein
VKFRKQKEANLIGFGMEFGFHSECGRSSREDFKHVNDMI